MSGVCMSKNKRCVQWVKYRPRKSRDRRLLEALLNGLIIHWYGEAEAIPTHQLSKTQTKQLIATKEAMQKGTK